MNHQVVLEPLGGLGGRVPDQTVQLLAVHASQRVQGEHGGDGAVGRGAVGGLTVQLGVPGQRGGRAGDRAARRRRAVLVPLYQRHRLQGGDGFACKQEKMCLLKSVLWCKHSSYGTLI